MYTVVTILIIIVCVLLCLVVMVQNAKGGGLASGFVSSGQIMGVQKTTDFIEKLTWGLAISLVVLCLVASLALPNRNSRTSPGSALQEQAESAPVQQAPAVPNPAAPAQQSPAPGK